MQKPAMVASTPSHDSQVSQFQVFGERRSGTNFTRLLIERNFALEPVFHYGWKHGFLSVPAVGSHVLLVGVARNPIDWLISMHATPFAVVPRLKDLSFSDFIRAEWDSIARPGGQGWRAAGFRQDMKLRNEVLQFDRHPIEGRAFRNILELRQVKLRALLGLTRRVSHAAVVRHEDLRDQPDEMLPLLRDHFALPAVLTWHRIDDYVGNKSNPKTLTAADISPEDRTFILDGLDLDLEAQFGYGLNFDVSPRA
ncbi:hypothetical protein KDD17_00295 [Sulfitobacter albidus]|uniref:Uncharacterized protein n=1 Tax=Sulfitobacter albidus TaxID=2829501 RepID=A0A975JDQ7_9RHOB|nr:hypothetical protein [Sulfitobacter albidus]QUJ76558.1 hypothetical protein KDD17_00295 [Sulfitobacter albidus]